MQKSENWRKHAKPTSVMKRAAPYVVGGAIGATLAAALMGGAYNAGRPDKTAAETQRSEVVGTGNVDRLKQMFYPTEAVTQTAATPAAPKTAAGARMSQPCNSDYPKFRLLNDSEVPEKIKKGAKALCAYAGDFLGDGEERLVGIAYSNEPGTGHFGTGTPYLFLYDSPGEKPAEGSLGGLDESTTFDGFQLKKFKITDIGIHRLPQIVIEYVNKGGQYLQVYGQKRENFSPTHMYHTTRVAFAKGDNFNFEDLNKDGIKEIIIVNGGMMMGTEVVKRPLTILSWAPSAYFQGGIVYSKYYRDVPLDTIQETKQRIAQTAATGSPADLIRIRDTAHPYVFFTAVDEMLRGIPNADIDKLYRELFNMEPSVLVNRLAADPLSMNKYMLAATFVERFVHHVKTSNDHLIGYDAGRGYTVTYGNQVYSGYGTVEEARKGIADLERRKQKEANRPSPYHTYETKTYDERSGTTTIKRETVIGSQSKTPQQWETERRLQQDPVSRTFEKVREGRGEEAARDIARGAGSLVESYRQAAPPAVKDAGQKAVERLGAIKGDVERALSGNPPQGHRRR